MTRPIFRRYADRLLASVRTHSGQIARFGVLGWLTWQYAVRWPRGRWLGSVLMARAAIYPVRFRPGSSDLTVFWQVFYRRDYDCLGAIRNPQLIIDCGANVGYTSAFLLTRFPSARVIAIEPDPGNFELLQENLRPYGSRAVCLCAGVWSHASGLVLDRETNRDEGEWAVQVREAAPGEKVDVPAVDIPTVMRHANADRIDILKMDVERSERVVFKTNIEWLGQCDNLVIEIHDPECDEVVSAAVEGHLACRHQSGDVTVFRRTSAEDHGPTAFKPAPVENAT